MLIAAQFALAKARYGLRKGDIATKGALLPYQLEYEQGGLSDL